jgi:methionine aminotransferase
VHQFNVFTVNTPVQHGLANYMADPRPYLDLPAFYQHKRDLFRAGLAGTRFKLLPCQGTYFQCVDYSAISDLPEAEFAKWLTSEIGVAAIPVSAARIGRGALLLRQERRNAPVGPGAFVEAVRT